ncbi:hypothetical protein niasHT_011232 [Heterodera trifolii]|uniref:Uncharacterized protein n=1 Tax=Heterodera trifolii TaxID=157864 RepID=A0ABD2L736_9BILA
MAFSADEDSDMETGAKRRLTDANQTKAHQRNGNSGTTRTEDGGGGEQQTEQSGEGRTRMYAKRYAILGMFIMLSASNAMQWIEYSIIAHIISAYYGVSYSAVDWTSMIYMLTYMVLMFPGSWFLEKFGLRKSILIGAFGNCFGAWLKMLSTAPDRFWLTFIAQTIVGSSQVFILGIPPRLAAVWFGPEQVLQHHCAHNAPLFRNTYGNKMIIHSK